MPGANRGIPDVFNDMLAEAAVLSPSLYHDDGRPAKRRRTAKGSSAVPTTSVGSSVGGLDTRTSIAARSKHAPVADRKELSGEGQALRTQTIYDSAEGSSDSSDNWEEVDLEKLNSVGKSDAEDDLQSGEISLTLGEKLSNNERKRQGRTRTTVAPEKKLRLEIHKAHLLCLLMHDHVRNAWCNDPEIQAALHPLLSKSLRSYLRPDVTFSQFQRSRSFIDGLTQAIDIWRGTFTVTARGLRKPTWTANPREHSISEDFDHIRERTDFLSCARKLEGSRDVGAQLFCAFLRGAGVDARLVCSLQVLPYASVAKVPTPQKPKPKIAFAGLDRDPRDSQSGEDSVAELSGSPSVSDNIAKSVTQNKLRRRIGQPKFGSSGNNNQGQHPPAQVRRKRFVESPCPVYWVEAFDEAYQKWIPVDPMVSGTVTKASKLEPSGVDERNSLSYVVAFDDDGAVRDVTRRYAKAYNGKTRRLRVENVEGGERWWKKILRIFRRSHRLDRDQLEDAELATKEAAEPMPRNVQDFKDHPYYALERHLKRNEVIHPKREVGKVSAGKTATSELEPVYRRRDVIPVKSADKWYRLGRELKPGEQPLKFAASRRGRTRRVDDPDIDVDVTEQPGVGLYAEFQTDVYTPPPIVRGLVPKNAYGNLDVYVPSMVPPGGVHIRSSDAARAARILGLDYADAVVRFEFKGRHGTAVAQGIVVAIEFQQAVEAVVNGLIEEQLEAETSKRSLQAVRVWKRFMIGLRILERLKDHGIQDEQEHTPEEVDPSEDEVSNEGGWFFAEAGRAHDRSSLERRLEERDHGRDSLELREEYQGNEDSILDPSRSGISGEGDFNGSDLDAAGGFVLAEADHGENVTEAYADPGGGFLTADLVSAATSPDETTEPRSATMAQCSPERDLGTQHPVPVVDKTEATQISSSSPSYSETNPNDAPSSPLYDTLPQSAGDGGRADKTLVMGDEADELSSLENEGSLLSHDPDDEDAEPEWLADDV